MLHGVQNVDAVDLYGFFHGHDYFGALQDFVSVSGKTIMVCDWLCVGKEGRAGALGRPSHSVRVHFLCCNPCLARKLTAV